MSNRSKSVFSSASKTSPTKDSFNDWLTRDYDKGSYSTNYDKPEDDRVSQPSRSMATRSKSPVDPVRRPSGSRGMLADVLEKMHQGKPLSQHDVSAALRDYNQMQSKMAELERKASIAELHVEDDTPTTKNGAKFTKEERDKLVDQVKRKDRLIEEYQKKLKTKPKNGPPKTVSISDIAPPSQTVDQFCNVYDNEWFNAFTILKKAYHEDDERASFHLFRIVKHAYIFCYDIAEGQRHAITEYSARLQEVMLQPSFTHPVSKLKYKPSVGITLENQGKIEAGNQLLQDYRANFVLLTVPAVQELFKKIKLTEIFETGFAAKAVVDYTDRVVELIWRMVVQDPPMLLHWLEPKQTVVKAQFKHFKRKGPLVLQTVWPAVFSKEEGDLLSKGVVMACSAADFD